MKPIGLNLTKVEVKCNVQPCNATKLYFLYRSFGKEILCKKHWDILAVREIECRKEYNAKILEDKKQAIEKAKATRLRNKELNNE